MILGLPFFYSVFAAIDGASTPQPPQPPEPQPVRVLVVDDDTDICQLIQARFKVENHGSRWQIFCAHSLHRALEQLIEHDIDVILLDLCLADSTGIETLERVRRVAHDTAIVVMTGTDDDDCGPKAMMEGAQEFLQKPLFDAVEKLPQILCHAMETQGYITELRAKQILAHEDGMPPRVQGACNV